MRKWGNSIGLLIVLIVLLSGRILRADSSTDSSLRTKEIIQSEIDHITNGTAPEKDNQKIMAAYRAYYQILQNSQPFYSKQQSVTCHKFQRIDRLIHQNIYLAADRVRAFRDSHDYQIAFFHQTRVEILTQLSLLTLQMVESNAEGGVNESRLRPNTYLTCVSGPARAEFVRSMQKRHAALMQYRNLLSGEFGLNNSTAMSDKLEEYQNGLNNRFWVADRIWDGLEMYTFLGKIQTYWKVGLAAWLFIRQNTDVVKSMGVTDPTLSGTSNDMVMGQYVFNNTTNRSPFAKDSDYQNYLNSIETFVSAAPNVDIYLYLLRLIEDTNRSVITEKIQALQKRLITKHTMKKGKERTANLVTKRAKEQ